MPILSVLGNDQPILYCITRGEGAGGGTRVTVTVGVRVSPTADFGGEQCWMRFCWSTSAANNCPEDTYAVLAKEARCQQLENYSKDFGDVG